MKKVEINKEQARTLSYAVSDYVNGLGEHDWIEGVFITPFGEDSVESIVVGVVYNNWRMGKRIQESNKTRLHMLSSGVGISVQVKDVSLDKCLDYLAYRNYEQPIKGMVKSGVIIYDASGRLHLLQEEFQRDVSIQSLESRGSVKMEPAIQYSKKASFY